MQKRQKNKVWKAKNICNWCKQLWDTYWVDLKNATNGQLLDHRKQRLYLGIETDIVIDYYSTIANDETKKDDDNINTILNDAVNFFKNYLTIKIKHTTYFPVSSRKTELENREHASIIMGGDKFMISETSSKENQLENR